MSIALAHQLPQAKRRLPIEDEAQSSALSERGRFLQLPRVPLRSTLG
jgi:hypothetical protein